MTPNRPKPPKPVTITVTARHTDGPKPTGQPSRSTTLYNTHPQEVIDGIDLYARAAEVHGEAAVRKTLAEMASGGAPSSAAEAYTDQSGQQAKEVAA
ncbi:MAG: hypothetical protein AAGD32_17390 [Planctomycetota bacterium]